MRGSLVTIHSRVSSLTSTYVLDRSQEEIEQLRENRCQILQRMQCAPCLTLCLPRVRTLSVLTRSYIYPLRRELRDILPSYKDEDKEDQTPSPGQSSAQPSAEAIPVHAAEAVAAEAIAAYIEAVSTAKAVKEDRATAAAVLADLEAKMEVAAAKLADATAAEQAAEQETAAKATEAARAALLTVDSNAATATKPTSHGVFHNFATATQGFASRAFGAMLGDLQTQVSANAATAKQNADEIKALHNVAQLNADEIHALHTVAQLNHLPPPPDVPLSLDALRLAMGSGQAEPEPEPAP